MGVVVLEASGIVAVPTAENAWGALTTIYTNKMPWKSFKVISQQQAGSYTTEIQLYTGSTAFGPLLVSDGAPDQTWDYDIPIALPPGTVIGAECWYDTTSPPNCNIQLIGSSKPAERGIIGIGQMGVVAGTANVGCAVGAWTQIGTVLPSLPIKRIRINVQQPTASQGNTFNVGFGASSTAITTIESDLAYGNASADYGWVRHSLDVDFLGTGNYLWIYNNGGTCSANIFYEY